MREPEHAVTACAPTLMSVADSRLLTISDRHLDKTLGQQEQPGEQRCQAQGLPLTSYRKQLTTLEIDTARESHIITLHAGISYFLVSEKAVGQNSLVQFFRGFIQLT